MRYKGYLMETMLRDGSIRFRLGYEPMLFRDGNSFVNRYLNIWGDAGSVMIEDLHECGDGVWLYSTSPSAEEVAGKLGMLGRARYTDVFVIPESNKFFNVDLILDGLDDSQSNKLTVNKDTVRNIAIKYLSSLKS